MCSTGLAMPDGRDSEVFVQLVPHERPSEPAREGHHWRHCFWLTRDAPWRRLVAAWAFENHFLEEDLTLKTLDGATLPKDSTPSEFNKEVLSLSIEPKAGAVRQSSGQAIADDAVAIRVTAFCEGQRATLHFRVPKTAALRKRRSANQKELNSIA